MLSNISKATSAHTLTVASPFAFNNSAIPKSETGDSSCDKLVSNRARYDRIRKRREAKVCFAEAVDKSRASSDCGRLWHEICGVLRGPASVVEKRRLFSRGISIAVVEDMVDSVKGVWTNGCRADSYGLDQDHEDGAVWR